MKATIAMGDATHAKTAEDLLLKSGANETVVGADGHSSWISGNIPDGKVASLSGAIDAANAQIDDHSTALTLVAD